MEKSTASALIVAGAMVLGGIFQAVVLRAAKRKREAEARGYEARTGLADSDSESDDPAADR